MNERYAVDPEAPSNARDLKVMLDQFGLRTGRFLSRYPENWKQLLMARFDELSDLERMKAFELLQRRRSSLLPVGDVPYQAATTWAGNAAVAKERHRAFDVVIGQLGNGYGWPALEKVLYDDDGALPAGVGEHVPMQAARYAKCALPLFAASSEVILVDKYFTLRDRFGERCRHRWPVMTELLKAAEASATCQSFRLVLNSSHIRETEGSDDALERDLHDVLNEAGIRRVVVKCDVGYLDEHGRYLLSIYGGLQFDHGFEEKSKSRNHVHWLSEPELTPLLKLYESSTVLGRRSGKSVRR